MGGACSSSTNQAAYDSAKISNETTTATGDGKETTTHRNNSNATAHPRDKGLDLSMASIDQDVGTFSKYIVPRPTPREKIERLRALRPYLLDNSLRESTVVQVYGHVGEDKDVILKAIQDVGTELIIVGSFGDLERVEDTWLAEKFAAGEVEGNWCTFAEVVEFEYSSEADDDVGIPIIPTKKTVGIQRAIDYGIQNVILEINCNCVNWDRIEKLETDPQRRDNHQRLKEHVDALIAFLRRSISKEVKVFVNFRDMMSAWVDCSGLRARQRMLHLAEHLTQLDQKIYGFLFEDPGGDVFPWDFIEPVSLFRGIMNANGWAHGHFLVHIHKKFGLADAAVLECLAHGCNGLWGAASTSGAGVGHACSLVTLTNLARLGNPHVEQMYNMPALYKAAVVVTKRSENRDPYANEEVIGSNAVHVVFGAAGAMSGDQSFDLAKFLGREETVRITTFTDADMMADHLSELFGKRGWSNDVTERMRRAIHDDLLYGRKWEYQSATCMLDLYQRCGGTGFVSEMQDSVAVGLSRLMELAHFIELKRQFEFWDSSKTKGDLHLSKKDFFRGFLSSITESFRSQLVTTTLDMLARQEDGLISWHNILVRADWTWTHFKDECMRSEPEKFSSIIVTHNILPQTMEVLEKRKAKQRQRRARAKEALSNSRSGTRNTTKSLSDSYFRAVKGKQMTPTDMASSQGDLKTDAMCQTSHGSAVLGKPVVFALVRIAHEVLREAMRRILETCAAGDMGKLRELWLKFKRFQDIHSLMEDGRTIHRPGFFARLFCALRSSVYCGVVMFNSFQLCTAPGKRAFFQILNDHSDNKLDDAQFPDAHLKISALTLAVDNKMENLDKAEDKSILDAVTNLHQFNNEHFKAEETIVVPIVEKMNSAGCDLRVLMIEILEMLKEAGEDDDLEFFMTFGLSILQDHPEKAQARCRQFAHALIACAGNHLERLMWDRWVQNALPTKMYADMAENLLVPYVCEKP